MGKQGNTNLSEAFGSQLASLSLLSPHIINTLGAFQAQYLILHGTEEVDAFIRSFVCCTAGVKKHP